MQKQLINTLLYINKKFFFKREHPFNVSKNWVLDLNYADFEYKHSKNLFDMYKKYTKLSVFRNAKVLDIWCWAWWKALYLVEKYNSNIVWIDLNETFLKEANSFAKEKWIDKQLKFKKQSATDMWFNNDTFDVIIMSDVIEHIPNTEKMFQEAYRVLKKWWIILFDFASYYHFFGHHIWDTIQIPWVHLFTTEDFRIKLYEESVKKLPDWDKRIALRIGKTIKWRWFTYLNKIKRKQFEDIISDFKLKNKVKIKIEYNMLKNKKILSKIPFIREVFVKHIIGVIIKNK